MPPRNALVKNALGSLARAVSSLWTKRWRVAGVLACGTSPGYAWWMVRHHHSLPRLADNLLTDGEVRQIVIATLVSLVLALVVIGVVHVRRRDRDRTLDGSVELCLRHGVIALTLPMIAALATSRLETASPWFTLALATTAAGIVGAWTCRLPGRSEAAKRRAWLDVWLPATLATVATGAFAYSLSELALLRHHGLATSTHDLGIYDNLFWNASHGNGLRSTLVRGDTHLAAHFDPILILLSPIHMLRPRAETLIELQTVWIAAGALPLYLLTQRKLGSHWAALALVLCYLLHPGIHGAAAYDFHSLSLAIPLLLAAVLALELDAIKSYVAVTVALLLVREDVALLTMSLGFYALLTGRRRVGLLTMVASLAYLVVVKLLIMPDPGLLMEDSDDTYGYAFYFEYLIPDEDGSVGTLLASLISNPVFVLRSVVSEDKLLYLARCYGPLLLLPLFARPGRVLLVYGLAFCLLGTKSALHSLHFQYITLHTPFAFALVPLVLADPQQSPALGRLAAACPQLRRAALTGCVLMSALVSWKYGAVIENDSFRSGYQRLVRSLDQEAVERYEWVVRARELIPADASVGATDHLVPHFSSREVIERYPDKHARGLDYLVIDRAQKHGRKVVNLHNLESSGAYVRIDALDSRMILLRRDPAVPLPKPVKKSKPAAKKKSKPIAKTRGKPAAKEQSKSDAT